MFRNNFRKMMHAPISVKFFWNAPRTLTPLPVLNFAILKLSTEFSLETAFLVWK